MWFKYIYDFYLNIGTFWYKIFLFKNIDNLIYDFIFFIFN